MYCWVKRLDIFTSKESSHRQYNKVKILAAIGLSRGRYSIFSIFMIWVYRSMRIIYVNFLCYQLSISLVGFKDLVEIVNSTKMTLVSMSFRTQVISKWRKKIHDCLKSDLSVWYSNLKSALMHHLLVYISIIYLLYVCIQYFRVKIT